MSDKFQAFASVVYVKMREGIFTGEEHLKHPIDLVDLRALAERDLIIRQQAEEIRLLRLKLWKQFKASHTGFTSNTYQAADDDMKVVDMEIEAAKKAVK